ncbi:MAG TPA: uridine kinase [Candidatus Hydrogenedentes bacterium]|nr:uridine kinase [Candidatus Hydrogenedentota bacterium]HPG65375.1 uridine kinase [Candidatus Hydrogenedentota bacterium]
MGDGRRPLLVGIAGPSGSGKTRLAEGLVQRMAAQGIQAALLAVDAYYRDLSHVPFEARTAVNFDAPEAIEDDLLVEHLDALATGRPTEKPVYDFTTHTRGPATERIEPAPVVLLEGLFALYWPPVRARLALKVFLDLDVQRCLERRTARDVAERGRSTGQVRAQFTEVAVPMYRRYVLPTQAFADLVLDAGQSPEYLVTAVLDRLMKETA